MNRTAALKKTQITSIQETKRQKKIHLLGILGETCKKCQRSRPWTYRVLLQDLTDQSHLHSVLCQFCIYERTVNTDTIIYDHLRVDIRSPQEILNE